MMKTIVLMTALSLAPVAALAQGTTIRDPAGGSIQTPAIVGVPGTQVQGSRPLTRDPAGGTIMSDEMRFRTYVVQQRVPSYRYAEPVTIGVVLPSDGVVYREVPQEFGAADYRYTVVNDRTVLVDPRTRRIVQIIE